MGTRNLTAVIINGEYKVAQYGQWDGYPSGQGITILDFLSSSENVEKLKSSLDKARFLDGQGKDKEFIESYNANAPEWSNDPDKRTLEQKHWWQTFMSRDLGGKILESIITSEQNEIILGNNINFAKDSLFCEWAYVIDLDKRVFEVFQGFQESPLDDSERFYSKESNDGYYPVKLIKSYSLDDLPSEEDFLKLESEDEEAA